MPNIKIKHAHIYVIATLNNLKVNVTDTSGNTLFSDSSGAQKFKGSKKGTPYAAQRTGISVAKKAVEKGVESADIFVSGPGSGRDAAIKEIFYGGINVTSITDVTKFPLNGCRAPKPRRV